MPFVLRNDSGDVITVARSRVSDEFLPDDHADIAAFYAAIQARQPTEEDTVRGRINSDPTLRRLVKVLAKTIPGKNFNQLVDDIVAED